ncbi:MAG: ATP-binding protein [Candidatus Cyclobacteriaceae bacterium M3_2C_046]
MMDIINQLLKTNQSLFITLAEIMVYTILISLILYHLIIFLGRKNFLEGKYYLFFNFYFSGLLLYLFIDSNAYFLITTRFYSIFEWTLFFTAVAFLIIYGSIIMILNALLQLKTPVRKITRRLYFLYLLLALIWLIPVFNPAIDLFSYFWWWNLLFTGCLFLIYGRFLVKQQKNLEQSFKIIGWMILSYTLYLIIYRLFGHYYGQGPRLPLWVINNILKITTAFVFAFALAKKSNQEYTDLQELKERLQEMVDQKTRQLKQAKDKIERINQQRTDYFISLAHETKTPLTLITNYLDRYIKFQGATHELEVVRQNLERLQNQMLDFLNLEKISLGKMIYDHQQVIDLTVLARQKLPLFQQHAEAKNITLSAQLSEGLWVKADPVALDRILNNLLDNAVKYAPAGTMVLLQLGKSESRVLITVQDQGPGIDPGMQEQIFEPYYQLNQRQLAEPGLGMGLHVVKQIVDSLQGMIKIESAPGQGSRFLIHLPLATPSELNTTLTELSRTEMPAVQKIKQPCYQSDWKNLLIVEDHPDMLNYLVEALNETFNVFWARNGQEALTELKVAGHIDLILSDVMMPELDGLSLYKALSQHETYSKIPFIFLTARDDDQEKLDLLKQGVTDFIFKPFSLEELRARIESALINSSNQRMAGLKQAVNAIHGQIGLSQSSRADKWAVFQLRIREYQLTERQVEIIKLVEQGLEYKQIADQLHLSVKTIHRHIQNLYEKMGVHSKLELIKTLFE